MIHERSLAIFRDTTPIVSKIVQALQIIIPDTAFYRDKPVVFFDTGSHDHIGALALVIDPMSLGENLYADTTIWQPNPDQTFDAVISTGPSRNPLDRYAHLGDESGGLRHELLHLFRGHKPDETYKLFADSPSIYSNHPHEMEAFLHECMGITNPSRYPDAADRFVSDTMDELSKLIIWPHVTPRNKLNFKRNARKFWALFWS